MASSYISNTTSGTLIKVDPIQTAREIRETGAWSLVVFLAIGIVLLWRIMTNKHDKLREEYTQLLEERHREHIAIIKDSQATLTQFVELGRDLKQELDRVDRSMARARRAIAACEKAHRNLTAMDVAEQEEEDAR